MYCRLCRNTSESETCEGCRELTEKGWLAEAYRRWTEQGERATKCCGGLSSDKQHIYFHAKGWECSTESVSVEMGVAFYHDQACTYYLRDFGNYCDSEEYEEPIAYLDPAFWEKLDAQLDRAALAAQGADLMSCDECGYHYSGDPHEHSDEED